MNHNIVFDNIKNLEKLSREDIKKAILKENANFNMNSLSYLIDLYMEKSMIEKVGVNEYQVISNKRLYKYELSNYLQEIHDYLVENYPDIKFQVWEFSQLNEFLNHLLANETYVIEVEGMFVESIFEVLRQKHLNILLNPTSNQFYLYANRGTIVVKKLISESPVDLDLPHHIRIEKLLVDIVVDKFTSNIINSSEIKSIYEYSFSQYQIDVKKLLRYARRRNSESKINKIIEEMERK